MYRLVRAHLVVGTAVVAIAIGALAPVSAQTPAEFAAQSLRISELEDRIRQLTGQVDQALHLITLLNDRVAELEAMLGIAGEGTTQGAVGQPPPLANIINRPLDLAAIALGQIPVSGEAAGPGNGEAGGGDPEGGQAGVAADPAEAEAPAPSSPQALQAYNAAYGLLLDGNTDAAITAFVRFMDEHPDAGLMADARFWLGDIYLQRMRHAEAANLFLDVIVEHPASAKVPDAYLKLGMSLTGMQQFDSACGVYVALVERFPDSPQLLLDRVAEESSRAGCDEAA